MMLFVNLFSITTHQAERQGGAPSIQRSHKQINDRGAAQNASIGLLSGRRCVYCAKVKWFMVWLLFIARGEHVRNVYWFTLLDWNRTWVICFYWKVKSVKYIRTIAIKSNQSFWHIAHLKKLNYRKLSTVDEGSFEDSSKSTIEQTSWRPPNIHCVSQRRTNDREYYKKRKSLFLNPIILIN